MTTTSDKSSPDTTLCELADAITRHRLGAPARIALDLVAPFGVLASQMALFAHPFIPGPRWRTYVSALTDETSWDVLHRMVEAHDKSKETS